MIDAIGSLGYMDLKLLLIIRREDDIYVFSCGESGDIQEANGGILAREFI